MYARSGIEQAPLQTYVSAALFVPPKSLVRQPFWETGFVGCVSRSPQMPEQWNALLLTLEGHSDLVRAIQFSPDGSKLASASYDGEVIVWDPITGVKQCMLEGHSDWVSAVHFSPDGRKLASASHDGKVIVWDPDTGVKQRTLEGHSHWVNAVHFSADGSKLASASNDGKVSLWDLTTNTLMEVIDVGSYISDLAFSADGLFLKTNVGSFKLEVGVGGSHSERACSIHLQYQKEWILRHGHKMIWLPPELRPFGSATAIYGEIMALGHLSGIVTFWEISC
jgi:WD40 repeat protein